ncbi:MAG: NAD(P)-dependent glycerol-3-phosphate dehydrogenase [Candidatus Riflebacteria bacterium]|nr:NAD(P)-dependent glycerol-3-phosphate dehydrogenase [Candidatus Riflebacteria bacterium]
MNLSVIGAGAWGTTLAKLFSENDHRVDLWTHEPEIADHINKFHENQIFLKGISLLGNITANTSLEKVVSKNSILIFAVPSNFLRNTALEVKKNLNGRPIGILNAAKGLESISGSRLSKVLLEVFEIQEDSPEDRIAALSGPNLAPEIASGKMGATVIASPCEELSQSLQEALSSKSFRVYRHSDRIGVELGGTLKNIFAIGAGILKGMNLGDNALAAYLTRSLHEMVRLGTKLGGQRATFYGLSGLGDLMATAMSPLSRNHRLGKAIAEGNLPSFQKESALQAIEGVETARMALSWGKKLTIPLPITEEICRVLFENKPPQNAAKDLMTRSLKDEED